MISSGFLISSAIEFGPLILFFLGAKLGNFFVGTALLLLATILAFAVSLWREKVIPLFSLITGCVVIFFGSATLYFHNPLWLVIEYTLYNGIFGSIILLGLLIDKPLLKPLFKGIFHITDHGWKTLSFRMGIFLIATALINEYVWQYYGPDHWVFFRFGVGFLLGGFCLFQLYLTRKERLPDAGKWGLRQ